tara:strand:+ start:3997 stop:4188 length:192 start_codon:yes stop_codon:yes gene_type:complete
MEKVLLYPKDVREILDLVDQLGWDYDRFSTSGQETYDKITSKVESIQRGVRRWEDLNQIGKKC